MLCNFGISTEASAPAVLSLDNKQCETFNYITSAWCKLRCANASRRCFAFAQKLLEEVKG